MISAAFSGGGGLGPDGRDAAAQFALSLSEGGVNIGLRTQSIQILRDMMYRLCERYLSGAIDKNELILQASRDQRTVAAVLAIEQLTGAVVAQSVALTSSSRVDRGQELLDAQRTLDKARAALAEKEKEVEKAKKAVDAEKPAPAQSAPPAQESDQSGAGSGQAGQSNGENGGATGGAANATNTKDQETQTQTQAQEELARATKARDDAQTNVEAAKEFAKAARDALKIGAGTSAQFGSSRSSQIDTANMSTVADSVQAIVQMVFNDSDTKRECLLAFRRNEKLTGMFATTCLKILGVPVEEISNVLDGSSFAPFLLRPQ